MRLDQYGNPIYNSQDVFNLIYQGKIDALPNIEVELNHELEQLETVAELKFKDLLPEIFRIETFDEASQQQWFMPNQYKELDIEEYIYNLTPPWDPDWTRVQEEMKEFKERGMLDLLRWLKYFVDTCVENNIVWGVGRGSSVASYVLFLMGVHQINSLKYNLDWQEFLR